MFADLRFTTATVKHAEDIEKFMHSEFRVREPITASINASQSDVCDFFHDITYSGYSHEKYSTVLHQAERLVGICLCSISTRDDTSGFIPSQVGAVNDDYADEIARGPYKHHKANQLVCFVSALEQGLHLLPGNFTKCLKVDVICVSKDIQGHGLGKELTQRSINIARQEGCDWVATAATAAASQAIFTRQGFETFYEIPYSNFRENGAVVFNDLWDGCTSGRFMALRLNE